MYPCLDVQGAYIVKPEASPFISGLRLAHDVVGHRREQWLLPFWGRLE